VGKRFETGREDGGGGGEREDSDGEREDGGERDDERSADDAGGRAWSDGSVRLEGDASALPARGQRL